MGPEILAQVLRPLKDLFRPQDYPKLLVGLDISDDAAVYEINSEAAVIQTLDFFTPVVDDAYDYGAIAAANAMSDVYAMGGCVALALNICGFPPGMPAEIIAEILRGGAEKVREAGAVIAGGHTIDDAEPKYGLAVMGLMHPGRILTKGGAKPGDSLLLTKPLGTGIITTAAKGSVVDPKHLAAAVASMKKLNKQAADIMVRSNVHACTDITGFALLGHAHEMAEKSGVQFRFILEHIPFIDGAVDYAEQWLFPGGTCNNERCYARHVDFGPDVKDEMRQLLFTPETSGGLLMVVPPDEVEKIIGEFAASDHPCWLVGEAAEGGGIQVRSDAGR